MSKKILRTFVIIGFATSIGSILPMHSANANAKDDNFKACSEQSLGFCLTKDHPDGICCTCNKTEGCKFSSP